MFRFTPTIARCYLHEVPLLYAAIDTLGTHTVVTSSTRVANIVYVLHAYMGERPAACACV